MLVVSAAVLALLATGAQAQSWGTAHGPQVRQPRDLPVSPAPGQPVLCPGTLSSTFPFPFFSFIIVIIPTLTQSWSALVKN